MQRRQFLGHLVTIPIAAELSSLAAADAATAKPVELGLDGGNPWPRAFELDRGQSIVLRSGQRATSVKLLDVTHATEPDYWTGQSPANCIFASARVVVEVDGRRAELLCRPYEMPKTIGGVRLYVETTKEWAQTPQLSGLQNVERDVRFSAVAADQSWGPNSLQFPIADYRWRSATYQNTWGSLVPFNVLYYHRGEDLGAIPDRLDLAAVLDGEVVSSPLPAGDGRSNGLVIDLGNGARIRYAHMNIETIDTRLTDGAAVKRGQILAKTGCTYSGKRSQINDPHVHIELSRDGMDTSFFPAFAEAYLRAYDDPLIAIAGGYGFVEIGGTYTLDGTRSLARSGREIVSYRWRLHDGLEVDGAQAIVKLDRPGFYAQELVVRTADGSEDRDSVHLRVYEPHHHKDILRGWAYYSPAREIRPGLPVTFSSRLAGHTAPARIDYGDGTPPEPIDRDAQHVYRRPGLYTVALSAQGLRNEEALLKLRVRVEPAGGKAG